MMYKKVDDAGNIIACGKEKGVSTADSICHRLEREIGFESMNSAPENANEETDAAMDENRKEICAEKSQAVISQFSLFERYVLIRLSKSQYAQRIKAYLKKLDPEKALELFPNEEIEDISTPIKFEVLYASFI